VLAHQMAFESPFVQADMVEVLEYPDLGDKYAVGGVPQTTINDGAGNVVGAVPEGHLVKEIQEMLKRIKAQNKQEPPSSVTG
jgi:hypothetical protein